MILLSFSLWVLKTIIYFAFFYLNVKCLKNAFFWQLIKQYDNELMNDIKVAYWISLIVKFTNIRLFSIAPHSVNALATLRWQTLSLLTSLLHLLSLFWTFVMASFFYCSFYSFRSSNYCDSNSCRSFTFLNLKAIADSEE